MKRMMWAALASFIAIPAYAAVSVRVSTPSVRVSTPSVHVAPVIKSVAPIKAPVSAVKAPTPIKAPAPAVKTAGQEAPVKATTSTTSPSVAPVMASSALVSSTANSEERKRYPKSVASIDRTSTTWLALAALSTTAIAWDAYTDQEVEAVNSDGSRGIMNVNPMFTVLCDDIQLQRAMLWRESCREHGQIHSSYCTVVAVNRFCDAATPEDVAGRSRVGTYSNVFHK